MEIEIIGREEGKKQCPYSNRTKGGVAPLISAKLN